MKQLNRLEFLNNEKQQVPSLALFFVICLATGLITYIFNSHGIWQQWTYLLHSFAGIFLSVILIPYTIIHFRRTLGLRRPSVIISGFISTLITIALVASGLFIMFSGQQENKVWVYNSHIISSTIIVIVLVVHLIVHWLLLPEKQKQAKVKFPSVDSTVKPLIIKGSLASVAAILLLSIMSLILAPNYSTTPAAPNYQSPYGEHPFRPSQSETYNNTFIDSRQIANSNDCANCHQDVSNQWFSSAHRQAASDTSYVSNISLLTAEKGIEATRYCEGCHAPVALLTGELSEGGKHGGIQGTLANQEGVGCMGCHGISKASHLKGVASYEYTPASDYLFGGYDFAPLNAIRHFLMRIKPEQHKKDMARPILSNPQVCATCHVQYMNKDMNDWGWIKMQDEYAAWLNSPFSQQHDQTFAASDVSRCQDCHMPLVTSNDPSADSDSLIRSHRSIGANTMLPLLNGDAEQLKLTKEFLQSSKMRLSIEKPRREELAIKKLKLLKYQRVYTDTPFYYTLGEEAVINIVVSNNAVGHSFPGGTKDINEAWLSFSATDSNNNIIFESGYLLDDASVEPNAYFYRSQPVNKDGELIWQHDLYNRVGDASTNVIKSDESDIVPFSFTVPAWAKGYLTITSTLRYRKLNTRYAKWALGDQYQELPIVDMARDSLTIPLQRNHKVFVDSGGKKYFEQIDRQRQRAVIKDGKIISDTY